MRRAARIDANQPEIVKALRAVGASVQILSAVGHGCPDILVGYQGRNFLFEIKDGSKPPSDRRLTPAEEKWFGAWRGQCRVVESEHGALCAVVAMAIDTPHGKR
jgi:hypothetical protein